MKKHLVRTVVFCLAVSILGFPSLLRADSVQMAHGWSVHPSGGQVAVDEAIAMMQKGVKAPQFIVLYTTADYSEQDIAKTLQSRFPEAKLFGMNEYKGVFSVEDYTLANADPWPLWGSQKAILCSALASKRCRMVRTRCP